MDSISGVQIAGDACTALPAARQAARDWSAVPLGRRLITIRAARRLIADRVDSLAGCVQARWRRSAAETVSAEIMPLADACRFLERDATRVLADRRPGGRGRPLWLRGTRSRVVREPRGVVLIVGPSNYPLMLPGIQALQALTAGNAVLLKPGRGGRPAALALQSLLHDAGLPDGLLTVLDESPSAARDALRAGVDHVVLTGSVETGRSVMQELGPRLIPTTMELSGCDAVFVRDDADLELAARALRFGMTFNGSFTCVAPRRIFVASARAAELERRLVRLLEPEDLQLLDEATCRRVQGLVSDALRGGARWVTGGPPSDELTMRPSVLAGVAPNAELMRADIAAPLLALISCNSDEQALELASHCPYALGATIFGSPQASAELAARVRAGIVVINDMIVPTADPRIPFGGRGDSGFGVTRGAEGLLEMTQPKTIIESRSRFRPHLDPIGPLAERVLPASVRLMHGGSVGKRIRALLEILAAARRHRSRKRGER